jgi:hypothetical protein
MDARKMFRHVLTFLLLFVAWLHPSPLFGASSNNVPLTSRCLFTNASELSDFDGDNRLDRAKLLSNGRLKIVHIAFGKPAWAHFSFVVEGSTCGQLISGDIDRDGDIDLAWISQASEEVVAWLGDGRGNFARASDMADESALLHAGVKESHPESMDSGDGGSFAAAPSSRAFTVSTASSSSPCLAYSNCPTPNSKVSNSTYRGLLKLRGPPRRFA